MRIVVRVNCVTLATEVLCTIRAPIPTTNDWSHMSVTQRKVEFDVTKVPLRIISGTIVHTDWFTVAGARLAKKRGRFENGSQRND